MCIVLISTETGIVVSLVAKYTSTEDINIPPVDSTKNDCASGSLQPLNSLSSINLLGIHKSSIGSGLIGELIGGKGVIAVIGSGTGGIWSTGIGGASVSTSVVLSCSPLVVISLCSFICS